MAWYNNGNVLENEPQQVAEEKLSNTAQPPPPYVYTSITEDRVCQPDTVAFPQQDTDLSLVTAQTC